MRSCTDGALPVLLHLQCANKPWHNCAQVILSQYNTLKPRCFNRFPSLCLLLGTKTIYVGGTPGVHLDHTKNGMALVDPTRYTLFIECLLLLR